VARCFAAKKFCSTAIIELADLSLLKEKPTPAVGIGIALIAFSYVIGLPAVIFLGALAVWLKEPLIGIVGIPLIYGISTLIFIIGIKLAGKKYIKMFCSWLARIILEKILGDEAKAIAARCLAKEPAQN
jgi:high-affinity Fe2+/Pb2+ permease